MIYNKNENIYKIKNIKLLMNYIYITKIMSNKQHKIISRLLAEAKLSKQATRVAAAICRGSKIISINVNNHRNKYGDEIRCAGHAEIAAIYNLYPRAFKRRGKGSYVLRP